MKNYWSKPAAFQKCGNNIIFSLSSMQALKMDNFDAKLLSNRSLCFLRMGDGKRAYEDATECAEIRPKWAKAHYRLGAAFMCMKVR
jgi:tetratricopeptide (TPR) repeat protein